MRLSPNQFGVLYDAWEHGSVAWTRNQSTINSLVLRGLLEACDPEANTRKRARRYRLTASARDNIAMILTSGP